MTQQEIQFFWPLTEQIDLDLDFTPCVEYAKKKYENTVLTNNGLCLTVNTGGTVSWAAVTNRIEPNFTIDIDQTPITVTSKKKPNFVERWIYKMLGMKWKAK